MINEAHIFNVDDSVFSPFFKGDAVACGVIILVLSDIITMMPFFSSQQSSTTKPRLFCWPLAILSI